MKNLAFIYPADPLHNKLDEAFKEEAKTMADAGFSIYGLRLDDGTIKPTFTLNSPEKTIVYRGWMLTPAEYTHMDVQVTAQGHNLMTSPENYLANHYLPNWYEKLLLKNPLLTPETVVVKKDKISQETITKIFNDFTDQGWKQFFIKDYVKSLKGVKGAWGDKPIVSTPAAAMDLIEAMVKYRGQIEEGLCIRRAVDLIHLTEKRYFIINGTVYTAENETNPQTQSVLTQVISAIKTPFFTIDVCNQTDGTPIVIEVGDGQVSDLVGWKAQRFASAWKMAANSKNNKASGLLM